MNLRSPLSMVRNRFGRERIYCTAAYWDAKAASHPGDAASMWNNNNLNALYRDEIARTFQAHLPSLQGLDVLEIGCGTGGNTAQLVAQGAHVVGIDFSKVALDKARERLPEPNPVLRHQSVFELNDQHAFDWVVSWGTLTMACRSRFELSEVIWRVGRALKPGGHVLLIEPFHQGFLHRVLAMPLSELLELMRVAGFRIDHVEHLHFWPARLLLAFVQWPEWITRPVYQVGQHLMHSWLHSKALGDYQAVVASLEPKP